MEDFEENKIKKMVLSFTTKTIKILMEENGSVEKNNERKSPGQNKWKMFIASLKRKYILWKNNWMTNLKGKKYPFSTPEQIMVHPLRPMLGDIFASKTDIKLSLLCWHLENYTSHICTHALVLA